MLTLSFKNSTVSLKRKKNRDNFCVLFLNILLRNHCHVTQNIGYFQHYMKLPFENEIFQLLSVWAEICPSEKIFTDNTWQRKVQMSLIFINQGGGEGSAHGLKYFVIH